MGHGQSPLNRETQAAGHSRGVEESDAYGAFRSTPSPKTVTPASKMRRAQRRRGQVGGRSGSPRLQPEFPIGTHCLFPRPLLSEPRATVLAAAHAAHPERFPAGLPHPPARPVEVWINPPKARATEETHGPAATRSGVLDYAGPGQLLSAHRSDLHGRSCLEAPA